MDWTRNVRIRQLRMLLRLVELGSISAVAQEFNITQPALSKWLKEFENTLGVELFVRQPRGLRPLAVALELADQARGILTRLDRLQRSINQIKHIANSQIAVGVSPIVAHTILAEALATFHHQHPKAFIQVQENSLDQLLIDLRTGKIDIIVGRSEQKKIFEDLHQINLADIQLRLAVGEQHPLAHKKQLTWDEITQYPWIVPPVSSPARLKMERLIQELNLNSPPMLIESNTVSLTAQLLRLTNLVAPLASQLMASLGLTCSLDLPELDQRFAASITMLWKPEDHAQPLVQDFINCVKTRFE